MRNTAIKAECTIFRAFNETSAGFVRSIEFILDRIKDGKSRELVEAIRAASGEEAKRLKKKLPAILFSGVFRQRNAASLVTHSGVICLDFDKFATQDELQAYRQQLMEDAYTLAIFISPSGNGLKVLVRIPADAANHRAYFDSLRVHYNSPHFDIGCSDVCRICFESYDPEVYINHEAQVWSQIQTADLYTEETPGVAIPIRSENQIIDNLLKWFGKKYTMGAGERNTNLFKLAAAFNDYGVNRNEAERICLQYEMMNFGKREIESIVDHAYKRTESFRTKFFEDTFTRRKIEDMVTAGRDMRAIVRTFPDMPKQEIETAIESVKDSISVTDFWEYTQKGAISILHNKFKYFMQEHNFFKYYPTGTGGFIFIKITENMIEETNKDLIKDYVLKYLEFDKRGIKPFNYMAGNTKYFAYEYLSFLDTKEINILEDSHDSAYLYFANKIVSVTRDGIKEIDYVDSNGYVWKNQIIDRPFKRTPSEGSEFSKLLFLIAGQDDQRYDSLRSVIGYLLHSFKTSANNKAIILNDETISDTPNGGSGKGLFWNAISHMKKVNSLDGKSFSFSDQFKYQTVSPDCQILVFDDVKNNFDFESLFSLITEGITLEQKGQQAIKLPVKKSPKILITTNYTVGGVGGSFDRRKFEVEFSSYFNAQNTPLAVFGRLLFDEWPEEEWNRFDNFMIECLQFYLAKGLIQHEFKNLAARKFISETSPEFYEFTQDEQSLPLNTRVYANKLFEDLIGEFTDLAKWLKKRKLKSWVNAYCIHKGYTLETGRDHLGRYYIIHATGKPVPTPTLVYEQSEEMPF